MSIWLFLQIFFNLTFFFGLLFCLVKIQKDREEDIRMAQGLRLLQSKIAVLEDLSDHADHQSKQIMSLLDRKMNEVKGVLKPLDDGLGEIHQALAKGESIKKHMHENLEHGRLFEQQQKVKYRQAASLVHQGWEAADIARHLELPLAEVRLVQKVNQKKIIYNKMSETARGSASVHSSKEAPAPVSMIASSSASPGMSPLGVSVGLERYPVDRPQ